MAKPKYYGILVKIWREICEKDSSRPGCVSKPWLCCRNTWWAFSNASTQAIPETSCIRISGAGTGEWYFFQVPHMLPMCSQGWELLLCFLPLNSLSEPCCVPNMIRRHSSPLVCWHKKVPQPFFMDWPVPWKGTNPINPHYLLYIGKSQRV